MTSVIDGGQATDDKSLVGDGRPQVTVASPFILDMHAYVHVCMRAHYIQ